MEIARWLFKVRPVPEVILPVLNEAEALPWVLAHIPVGFEPIVIDNGSTDGSAQIARRLGARVLQEQRRGFGAACFAGLRAARHELVCFMDCDGSLDPRDLVRICAPVQAGSCQLMLGARKGGAGSSPLHARLANRALAGELRRRTGVALTDLGPMRAAWRGGLLELGLRDRGFGWPLEMVLSATRAGWDIGECDVTYLPRKGKSKVSGSALGSLRAVRDMARVLAWTP